MVALGALCERQEDADPGSKSARNQSGIPRSIHRYVRGAVNVSTPVNHRCPSSSYILRGNAVHDDELAPSLVSFRKYLRTHEQGYSYMTPYRRTIRHCLYRPYIITNIQGRCCAGSLFPNNQIRQRQYLKTPHRREWAVQLDERQTSPIGERNEAGAMELECD